LSERRLFVFIDVGYLKRQGAEALGITGPVVLDGEGINNWCSWLEGNIPGARFVRAYLYDAEHDPGHSDFGAQRQEFDRIAERPLVRLRLGHLVERSAGTAKARFEQKGVDTLLVLDMLRMAYQGTYDQALLVAGDRDFEEVVKEVQDYLGRQVVLLTPEGGSVSKELRQVADTHDEIPVAHLNWLLKPRDD
jgi:uncharacterized LabA/DUF88 family protein